MTSSSCVCGNIKILGQSVPHFVYPNLPPTENLRLRYIKNLYSVQKHSMEIRDFNEIQSRPLSKLCVHMKCSSCDSQFPFFFWRGYTYYGRIHAVNPKIKPSCLTSQIDRNDQKGCKSLSSRRQVMQQAKKKVTKKEPKGGGGGCWLMCGTIKHMPAYAFFFKPSQTKVLYKITSQIKCYTKRELQKDVDSKFKAVFHSISSL